MDEDYGWAFGVVSVIPNANASIQPHADLDVSHGADLSVCPLMTRGGR
jgi:hypothetical protein